MGYKNTFKEIMREYESDRDQANKLLKERRAQTYERIPRIKEIDLMLAEAGISITKKLLSAGADGSLSVNEELLQDLQRQTLKLKEEKESLLRENGIPENYFTDIYRCAHCRDTGYISSENGVTERCACLKQRLIDKYYDLSTIRPILEYENFDTFDLRYYSDVTDPKEGLSPRRNMQLIYQTAMNFVLHFGEPFQNLLFYGGTGLGKTFLCNCIAKDLLDRGYTVLYTTAPQIFKRIEDQRFNRENVDDPEETIDALTEVDLLILDDLGSEFSTVITDTTLFNIINQRLLAKKSTVISTNLSTVEFMASYSERVFSRFLGHYKMTKFYGEDIRAKKKYSGRAG